MSEEHETSHAKIGAGHLEGMGRAGLKELGQALVAFPDSTIRPVEEPGIFGNPTPQIVTEEMGKGYGEMLEMHASRGAMERECHDHER